MTFLAKESYNFFFNSNIWVLITDMPEWLWNEQKRMWYFCARSFSDLTVRFDFLDFNTFYSRIVIFIN